MTESFTGHFLLEKHFAQSVTDFHTHYQAVVAKTLNQNSRDIIQNIRGLVTIDQEPADQKFVGSILGVKAAFSRMLTQ